MTETELQIYRENKKQLFTDSKMLSTLAKHVNRLCENTECRPELAEKYWKIFDNQENIINRYNLS